MGGEARCDDRTRATGKVGWRPEETRTVERRGSFAARHDVLWIGEFGFVGGKCCRRDQVKQLNVHAHGAQSVAQNDGGGRRPRLEIRRRHRDVVVFPKLVGVLVAEPGDDSANEDARDQRDDVEPALRGRRNVVDQKLHADVAVGCLRERQREEHDDGDEQLGAFEVTGDLTIREITQQVTFNVDLTVESESSVSGLASTTVLREDFNLTIPSVPQVASVEPEVKLELECFPFAAY